MDGSYLVENPSLGLTKIAVRRIPGAAIAPTTPVPVIKDQPAMPASTLTPSVNPPAKYASPENGLKYEVKGGKETFDIQLTP